MTLDWPNLLVGSLIATAVAIAVAYLFYRLQKRESAAVADHEGRFLRTIAVALERAGYLKLVRGADGNITGGEAIVIMPNTGRFAMTGNPAELKLKRADPPPRTDEASDSR